MKILSNLFAVAIVAMLAVGFSSCKKECVECTVTGTSDVTTLCEADYGSKLLYDAAKTAASLVGTCTVK